MYDQAAHSTIRVVGRDRGEPRQQVLKFRHLALRCTMASAICASTSPGSSTSALGGLREVGHLEPGPPAHRPSRVGLAQHRHAEREIRVERQRLLQQLLRPHVLDAAAVHDRPRAQVELVRLGAARGRAVQHRALSRLQLDLQRFDDALGDLGLHLEQVVERAIEPLGPQRVAVGGAHELRADARAVAGAAHAADQHVVHAQLARHRARRHGAVAVGQRLGARCDAQAAEAGEVHDEVFCEPGREERVVRLGAQQLERQHRQPAAVGSGPPAPAVRLRPWRPRRPRTAAEVGGALRPRNGATSAQRLHDDEVQLGRQAGALGTRRRVAG
jgi:hypothetical protein